MRRRTAPTLDVALVVRREEDAPRLRRLVEFVASLEDESERADEGRAVPDDGGGAA